MVVPIYRLSKTNLLAFVALAKNVAVNIGSFCFKLELLF